jgi:prepilin-type N-terminal cleavage/methylation domain-containing protein
MMKSLRDTIELRNAIMDTTQPNHSSRLNLAPRSSLLAPRGAFTLVELLVVITIIGILASLIVVAAVGAMGKAAETRIKSEINQMDAALVEYKNKTTAFPPNCQVDGSDAIIEATIYNDLVYHMNQAFPRHQEPPALINALAGLDANGAVKSGANDTMKGGMTAAEALVFWLSGFSADPKYPISGEGGPSYEVASLDPDIRHERDPVETRNWTFPFDIPRLSPRNDDGFFPAAGEDGGERYIEYQVAINGRNQTRRINFWQYRPRNSEQPYLFFDTSRHTPDLTVAGKGFDPPAATELTGMGVGGNGLHVHAFKKEDPTATSGISFVNPEKFQIMHCGRDDDWDEAAFDRMSVYEGSNPDLGFPEGPFIGPVADTIVNFTEQTTIEDAQEQ